MAESNFIPINIPKPFNPDKNNISKDWRIWKNEFLIYLELISSSVKFTEKGKAYRLLNCIGTKGIEAMNEMTFENSDERENMDILLKKFDEIFDSPFDEVEERYKFFSRRKNPNESLSNYVADITEKASKCNFGDQMEKFLIDMIILNMDKDYQHAAFALDHVSLPSIIQIYNQQLIYNQKMKEVMDNEESLNSSSESISGAGNTNYYKSVLKDADKEKSSNNVQNLTSDKYKYTYTKNNNLKQQIGKSNDTAGNFSKDSPLRGSMEPGATKSPSKAGPLCSKCLTNHMVFTRCPAYNATCSYCFENGHYTTACTLKNTTEETANLSKHASNKKNESLAKCSWCETRHAANQCPHDKDCTLCEIFPHNVCFNCRSNPHTHTCYYKEYVTLPTPQGYPNYSTKDQRYTNVATAAARNTEQTRERGCSRCGCLHPPRKCLAYNKRCSSCDKLGHFEWKCKSRPTNRALEDCPICKTRRLQHLNKNRYFCNRCAKFYFINGSDEDDDDDNGQETDTSCTIS